MLIKTSMPMDDMAIFYVEKPKYAWQLYHPSESLSRAEFIVQVGKCINKINISGNSDHANRNLVKMELAYLSILIVDTYLRSYGYDVNSSGIYSVELAWVGIYYSQCVLFDNPCRLRNIILLCNNYRVKSIAFDMIIRLKHSFPRVTVFNLWCRIFNPLLHKKLYFKFSVFLILFIMHYNMNSLSQGNLLKLWVKTMR